jgi:hypothetical protein
VVLEELALLKLDSNREARSLKRIEQQKTL